MPTEPIWEVRDALKQFLHHSEGISNTGSQKPWDQMRTLWDWLRARALVAIDRHLEALPILEDLAEDQSISDAGPELLNS